MLYLLRAENEININSKDPKIYLFNKCSMQLFQSKKKITASGSQIIFSSTLNSVPPVQEFHVCVVIHAQLHHPQQK